MSYALLIKKAYCYTVAQVVQHLDFHNAVTCNKALIFRKKTHRTETELVFLKKKKKKKKKKGKRKEF